jgi:5S rRNA maturation endonuclease (ribonuclease M5)
MGDINLNSIVFDERITKESILKLVSQEDIFRFYLDEDIREVTKISSPFRDDRVPSFSIYYHRDKRHTLMFYDFATKDCGDFIVLVMKLYGLSYGQALGKIAYDMKLSDFDTSNDVTRQHYSGLTKMKEKKAVNIGINRRAWNNVDKVFWTSFGIKKTTLEKYHVCPIKYVFYNDNPVLAEPLAYAYKEYKDDILSYKIYQPKSANKSFKWINNANYSVHQGYTQLPQTGDLLIITKSLKDVMSLHDVVNISSIGLQSESVTMKDVVMDEYKSRFKHVICLFDNDKAGKSLSVQFAELYNVPYMLIPEMKNVTDFSDLVKQKGAQYAKTTIKKLITKTLKNEQI